VCTTRLTLTPRAVPPPAPLPSRPRRPAAAAAAAAGAPLPVVLGSASAGRRAVVARRGLRCATLAADIDERAVAGRAGATPAQLALAVAHAKADALLPKLARAPCVLVTADQVVVGPDGGAREKPASAAEARAFLASYAGADSRTVSAVVVTNTATGARAQGVAVERVAYAPSLARADVLDAALQPAVPVDARALRAGLRAGAGAAGAGGSSGAAAGGGGKRRRSARLSSGGLDAAALPPSTVSVLTTAGAVMIEHPAVAAHISAIERAGVVHKSTSTSGGGGGGGSSSSSSSSSAAPSAAGSSSASSSNDDDDDDVIDSIYGLPWRLTAELVGAVTGGTHPWATAGAAGAAGGL
jgi:predicted house-cleaning NTP pyrophosphatase (Maf/HAM1 superfamily)